MANNFGLAGASLAPEYRNVMGHIEVYIDGEFFCSADSRREAEDEFYYAFGNAESDDECRRLRIKNVRREIRYGY